MQLFWPFFEAEEISVLDVWLGSNTPLAIKLLIVNDQRRIDLLSANPTKWSNTLKQLVDYSCCNVFVNTQFEVRLKPQGLKQRYEELPGTTFYFLLIALFTFPSVFVLKISTFTTVVVKKINILNFPEAATGGVL